MQSRPLAGAADPFGADLIFCKQGIDGLAGWIGAMERKFGYNSGKKLLKDLTMEKKALMLSQLLDGECQSSRSEILRLFKLLGKINLDEESFKGKVILTTSKDFAYRLCVFLAYSELSSDLVAMFQPQKEILQRCLHSLSRCDLFYIMKNPNSSLRRFLNLYGDDFFGYHLTDEFSSLYERKFTDMCARLFSLRDARELRDREIETMLTWPDFLMKIITGVECNLGEEYKYLILNRVNIDVLFEFLKAKANSLYQSKDNPCCINLEVILRFFIADGNHLSANNFFKVLGKFSESQWEVLLARQEGNKRNLIHHIHHHRADERLHSYMVPKGFFEKMVYESHGTRNFIETILFPLVVHAKLNQACIDIFIPYTDYIKAVLTMDRSDANILVRARWLQYLWLSLQRDNTSLGKLLARKSFSFMSEPSINRGQFCELFELFCLGAKQQDAALAVKDATKGLGYEDFAGMFVHEQYCYPKRSQDVVLEVGQSETEYVKYEMIAALYKRVAKALALPACNKVEIQEKTDEYKVVLKLLDRFCQNEQFKNDLKRLRAENHVLGMQTLQEFEAAGSVLVVPDKDAAKMSVQNKASDVLLGAVATVSTGARSFLRLFSHKNNMPTASSGSSKTAQPGI